MRKEYGLFRCCSPYHIGVMSTGIKAIDTPHYSGLSRVLLGILAVAAGLTVANNYYNQAMLGQLAHEFRLSSGTVSVIPVLTQLGNVAGILFSRPPWRSARTAFPDPGNITALIVALITAALAPSFVWLAMLA